MKFLRTLLAAVSGFTLLGFQAEAIAQVAPPPGGTITYEGLSAAAVPTLSEWGIAGLAVLIAVVGYRYGRTRLGGKPLAAVLIAAALGFGGILGDKVMRADAAPPIIVITPLSNPAGGSVQICSFNTEHPSNTTSIPLRIVSVTPLPGSSIGGGTCVSGLVLAPGATCTILFIGSSAACSD